MSSEWNVVKTWAMLWYIVANQFSIRSLRIVVCEFLIGWSIFGKEDNELRFQLIANLLRNYNTDNIETRWESQDLVAILELIELFIEEISRKSFV